MAKQEALYLGANVNTGSFQLTSAHTTATQAVFTAGSNDSDVKGILVSSNDTAAINLQLYIARGGTDYLIGTVNIPISAGVGGTVPAVDLLNSAFLPGLPVDNVGKRYIPLKTGDVLKVAATVTMTAAKTCTINVFGYDY
jgi:hypothetical protein